MEAYAAVLLWAIPEFFILVVIEITFGHFTKKQTYTLMDTLASLSSGMTNVIKDVLKLGLILISYPFLVKNLSLYENRCLVLPNSSFRRVWDIVSLVLLLYVALFTPVQIAFYGDTMSMSNWEEWVFVFILDRIVDSKKLSSSTKADALSEFIFLSF